MKKISVLCLVLAASLHSFAAQSRVCFLLDLECQDGGQTKHLSETDQDCRKLAKELNRRWLFKEEERCPCTRYKEVCNDHTGTYYEADGCADHCTDMTDEQNSEMYECSVETECEGCCPNDKVKCKETEYKLCESPTKPEVPADKKTCLEPGAHESETKYPSCVCDTNVYKYNETNCGGAALKLTGDSCTGDNGTWYKECKCAEGYTKVNIWDINCSDDCKYGCDLGNGSNNPLPDGSQLYCWSGASCIDAPTINDKCSAEGEADFDYYWTGYTVKSEDTETPPTTYCDNLEVDCDKLGYDTGIAETGVTCKDKTEPYRCMFNHEKVFCATGICYYTATDKCEKENFNSVCETPYEGCYEPTRCKEMTKEEKAYDDDGYKKEPCYSEKYPFIGYERGDDKGPDKYGCYKCVSVKCQVDEEKGIFRLPDDDSKDKDVLSDEEIDAGIILKSMFQSGAKHECKQKGCGLDPDFYCDEYGWCDTNRYTNVVRLRKNLYSGKKAETTAYKWNKSNAGDEGQYELTNPNCDKDETQIRYKTCTSKCEGVKVPDNATATKTCTACNTTVDIAWECDDGYVENNGICEKCKEGYFENNGVCEIAECKDGCVTTVAECYSDVAPKGSSGWGLGESCNSKSGEYDCRKCECHVSEEECAYTEDQLGNATGKQCCNGKYTCASLCNEVPVPENAIVTETCMACGEEVSTAWVCPPDHQPLNGKCQPSGTAGGNNDDNTGGNSGSSGIDCSNCTSQGYTCPTVVAGGSLEDADWEECGKYICWTHTYVNGVLQRTCSTCGCRTDETANGL